LLPEVVIISIPKLFLCQENRGKREGGRERDGRRDKTLAHVCIWGNKGSLLFRRWVLGIQLH
jgi:hypothetical protein